MEFYWRLLHGATAAITMRSSFYTNGGAQEHEVWGMQAVLWA